MLKKTAIVAIITTLLIAAPTFAGGGRGGRGGRGQGGPGGPGNFDPNQGGFGPGGGPGGGFNGGFDPNQGGFDPQNGGFGGGPGGPGGGPGGGRGGRGGPGGGGVGNNLNLVQGLQEPLLATAEEWKIIAPVLARVVSGMQTLQSADAGELALSGQTSNNFDGPGGFGGGPGGGGGRGGPGGNDTFGGPSAQASGGRGGRGGRGGPGGPGGGNFDQGGRGGFGPDGAGAPAENMAPAARPLVPDSSNTLVNASVTGKNPVGSTSRPEQSDSNVSARTVTLPQAITDLQSVIADPSATDEQLKAHLEIVRDARAKTKGDIQAARKELLLILTPDQEAILVSMGYLD